MTLKTRTVADELEDLVLTDIVKNGGCANEETTHKYQIKLNQAFDVMVAET